MKILLVSKFLTHRGGVETYVLDLGKCLEDSGHDVQYFGIEDEDNVVGNRWNILAPHIELGGKQGISRISDILKSVNSSKVAQLMGGLLQKFKPDVIHFNNIHYHLTPSVIEVAHSYKKESPKPVRLVMTMHDYHSVVPCDGCMNNRTYEMCDACLDGRYARCAAKACTRGGRAKSVVAALEASYWNRRHVYKKLDWVICPSGYMKGKFDKVPDFSGKTVHIPNFANLVRASEVKGRYVLYFGAYNKDKGVETLLNIARRHPEIPFRFCGRGPCASQMKGIDNVQDLGFRTGDELHSIVRRASFAVVPSEWLENSPFAVIEALCSGTPVLGANIGGIPELIANGETGELFEFRNEMDLERRLVGLWNDQARCARYADACASYEPMSEQDYVSKLMKLYV